MKSVELNANWSVSASDGQIVCDLPYDVTANAARDYALAFGGNNGYIPAERAVFERTLPQIKDGLTELVVDGACGYGEVFVNDESVGKIDGRSICYFGGFDLSGSHNTLRIELFTSAEMSDKYLGLGIGGGVKLNVYDSDFDIDDLFVKCSEQGGRIYADTALELYNYDEEPKKFVVECTALNARGKRAGKKQRKITLRAGQHKPVEVRVRINNPYEWSVSDPYMYTMNVRLISEDKECSASTRFGIVSRSVGARGLYLNNHRVKLFGAYLSHADAALGCASIYSNEKRKLTALKNMGYNAVHFVGMPTAATLDACDDVGLYAYVDLFEDLGTAKAPLGSIFTRGGYGASAIVKALRNHPSVTVYGIADDVPECYGRGNGYEKISEISDEIRVCDRTRPITISSREQVPTYLELEAVGCRNVKNADDAAAINAGREKHLFETLTEGAFECVDVAGFNYLYPLYESAANKYDRLIIGSRTSPDRAYDSLEAAERCDKVIGDFSDCGMDYPGGGKLNEIYSCSGDIDAIGCDKPRAVYKSILLGKRKVAYISPRDPETNEPTHLWNWPRFLGQKMDVDVYTSGDVVALYLDGRIIGRKLAGKVNKHMASFKVDYYPGTLEAVAYYRGVECARATLSSAGTPKTIKLSAFEKNLSVSANDYGFVYVEVCDKEGMLVPYAMRQLTATVTGGTLVGFVNADPMLRKNAFDECPAYGGKALAVIKPDPGEVKATVKITGDGLLASRISFKIKN